MLRISVRTAMLVACFMVSSGPAAADTDTPEFKRDLAAFIARLNASPHAPPGFVVVAFHEDRTVFEQAYGVRNRATGAPMTLDTPVYNASITKAYTGVLAALLDAERSLPLTATLKDVWPEVTLRAPLDPAKITAAQLLSHSSALFDGGLLFRSNTTGQVDLAAIPGHLSRYAQPTRAFRYSNVGPYIYSAMAQTRTGQDWHQAIRQRVLRPLGLKDTVTRIEDRPMGDFAHCHLHYAGKWSPVPLKPSAILNAAGGMYATARDTARFMKAIVTDGRSAGGRIPAHILRRTWQRQTVQDVDFAGLKRDGYGLGWDLGVYDGERYGSRSGGYYGCRTYALFVPERKFGIAVLSVGDTAVNTFNVAILKQAIDLWTADPEAAKRGDQRIAEYRAAAATAFAPLQAADPRLERPAALDDATGRAAPGVYDNPRLGRFVVERTPEGLVATAGALAAGLVPLSPTRFLLLPQGEAEAGPVQFVPDDKGGFASFVWDDDRFDRVPG